MRLGLPLLTAGNTNSRSKSSKELLDKILYLYLVERKNTREIARALAISHMTVYRLLNKQEVRI